MLVFMGAAFCACRDRLQPPTEVKAAAVRHLREITTQGIIARGWVDSIEVSWRSVEGADSYTIYWDTRPGVTTATGDRVSGAKSPYHHLGKLGQQYFFVVTRTRDGRESAASREVSATLVEGRAVGGIFFVE